MGSRLRRRALIPPTAAAFPPSPSLAAASKAAAGRAGDDVAAPIRRRGPCTLATLPHLGHGRPRGTTGGSQAGRSAGGWPTSQRRRAPGEATRPSAARASSCHMWTVPGSFTGAGPGATAISMHSCATSSRSACRSRPPRTSRPTRCARAGPRKRRGGPATARARGSPARVVVDRAIRAPAALRPPHLAAPGPRGGLRGTTGGGPCEPRRRYGGRGSNGVHEGTPGYGKDCAQI